jgi:outer membrane protein
MNRPCLPPHHLPRSRPCPWSLAAGATLLLATPAATAQAPAGDAWTWRAGTVLVAGTPHPGSDRSTLKLLPNLEARRGLLVIDPLLGVGVDWQDRGGLRLRAGLGLDFTSRSADDDERLRPLEELKGTAALRLSAEQRLGSWMVAARLLNRLARQSQRGSTLDTEVGYTLYGGPQGALTAGVSARWMDGLYARHFFGLDSNQAALTGLPVHAARSGLMSAGLYAQAFQRLGEQWSGFMRLNLQQLQGDAASSPITRQRLQPGLVLGVSRQF